MNDWSYRDTAEFYLDAARILKRKNRPDLACQFVLLMYAAARRAEAVGLVTDCHRVVRDNDFWSKSTDALETEVETTHQGLVEASRSFCEGEGAVGERSSLVLRCVYDTMRAHPKINPQLMQTPAQ